MGGIERYNVPLPAQKLGNDSVYGTGVDGNVVIASNPVTITRDMYYDNLTVNANCHLNTNGFRVFVKNTLTLNGSIGIRSTDSVSAGTLESRTPAGTSTTYSVGGSSGNNGTTASQIPASLLYDLERAVGLAWNDGSPRRVTGGAGGNAGANGTLNPGSPGTSGSAGSPGSAGTAGGAGVRGEYPPHAHYTGHEGGRGHDGTPGNHGANGSPGTPGAPGTSGTAGTGGAGGGGGPVVLVVAKNISGTGTVFSQGVSGGSGTAATAGTKGADGTNGPAGGTGSNGSAGSKAPDKPGHAVAFGSHGHTRPSHYWGHYPGGHDHHYVHLPHAYKPHHHTHGYKHQAHYIVNVGENYYPSPSHYNFTESYSAHHNPAAIPADHFYHQGGVNHDIHGGNPNHVGGLHGNFAHLYAHGWHGHYDPGHASDTKFSHGHRGHRFYQDATAWAAGPSLAVGHYSFNWPGGAGGAAGTGGAGGAGGAKGIGGAGGSPTNGATGLPGGGGGIIIVTETTPSVSLNTVGGTSAGYTGASGMQVVVLNS